MQKSLLTKEKILTLAHFKKGNRLDRFRLCLLDSERFESMLNPRDKDYFDYLHLCFQYACTAKTKGKAIKIIQEKIEGFSHWTRANQLYTDMCELFGNTLLRNKDVSVANNLEWLYRLAVKAEELAESPKDFAFVAAIVDKAAKLEREHQPSTEYKIGFPNENGDEGDDVTIEITNDPKYIREASESDYWNFEDEAELEETEKKSENIAE